MNTLNHIAIIMDGNGRWAKQRNLPRTMGHKRGVEKVREIAIYANKLGIKCLTLYAFSTENWKRPENEVNYLMSLPKVFFNSYLKEIMENNIKIEMIGEMERIPGEAKSIFESAIEKTKNNTGMVLNFALNYGGQSEIVRACKLYAQDFKNGLVEDVDEESFTNYLYTKDLPEVDLMIRTSNEQRISNFLLYQLAYSEFIFTDTLWPDFTCDDLDRCIDEFNHRTRRFGGANETKNN